MEKKLITAIALSILIMVAFQFFVAKPSVQVSAPTPAVDKLAGQPMSAAPAALSYVPPKPSVEEKEFVFETGKYILTFSNIGGAIKDARLKDFDNLKTKELLELVHIKNPAQYLCATTTPADIAMPDLSGYDVERKDDAVICHSRSGNFDITKKYILHKSKQYIELQFLIKNISSSPTELSYKIIGGSGVSEANAQDKNSIEVTSKIDGKHVGYKRPRVNERIFNPGIVGWAALKNKYFSVILKPTVITKGQFHGDDSDGNLFMGVETDKVILQPRSSLENKYVLYIGPSSIPVLKEQGLGFEETINYGFFGGISKALIVVLKLSYAVVRSWGLSIILLSIFLNIILFPLTVKSFKSMQKMQELHPQMEKLKIQLKDNPQKLNKEIMELYKKYNINPMSGCLPMLLQMPIFIALYQALMKSIELRGASFLWIKDLSSPEAIPLPISFPIIGNTINILPLIMIAAMVVQQKMSTKSMGSAVTDEQKQQQKMMLIIMPIMFGFIFYNMPSGLVLYWVVNTILTIVEQKAILKNTNVT